MNKTQLAMLVAVAATVLAQPSLAAKKPKKGKEEMVKCYSETCAGKVTYKGKSNSCNQPTDAIECPKSLCDTTKGLKIAEK
ncbi:MAG: hypothetical protein HYR96_07665 [Deltaproteobacteria bacterium]|nr:hypothetical protein [Deltaproteobacteria bacterium]MBI3293167.1 hypothetical protein [Deltaproteobacteria bacterium]